MSVADIIFAVCGLVLGIAGFYWQYQRPERRRRQRFFDEAMGHDGSDGLPIRKSLFDRMDSMQTQLDRQGDDIASLNSAITSVPRQRSARSIAR